MQTLDEKIAAIRAGLEGVTPGPWDAMASGLVRALDGDLAMPLFEPRPPFRPRARMSKVMRQEHANSHHVSRLDPDTVRAILDALDEARKERDDACKMYLDGVMTKRAIAAEAALDEARAENARLREALADAIRRPMGIVPESAIGLVSSADLDDAEQRRAALEDK